jgi:histidine kinase 2/3/4 (cytokinin receptor)
MVYLTGNIHDLSKISCGKFEIDRFPMNIEKEIKKVKQIERELVRLKGIKLHCMVLKPLPRYVYGDPIRFEQILINLLGNSIKFTHQYVAVLLNWVNDLNEIADEEHFLPPEDSFNEKKHKKNAFTDSENFYDTLNTHLTDTFENIDYGAIENQMQKYKRTGVLAKRNKSYTEPNNTIPMHLHNIEVLNEDKDESEAVKDSIRDSGLLVVDIIDTGIGMSSERIQKLSQLFSQANKSIRKQFGGTGLGLWITEQLVTVMNGFIEVKSEVKCGSKFRVTIPFSIYTAEELHSENCDHSNDLPFTSNYIRTEQKIIFRGKGKLLKEMKLLVLEDDSVPDDKKLEQLYKLIARDKCEVTWCSYSNIAGKRKLDITSFDVILVIASAVTISTKAIIKNYSNA